MKGSRWIAAAVVGLNVAAAQAADPPNYGAFMGSYILQDSSRNADYGWGGHLLFGLPLSTTSALEFALHGNTSRQEQNNALYDRAYGLGVDARFGPLNWSTSPFLVMGLGAVVEDIQNQETSSAYANLGFGLLQRLNRSGLSLRFESRAYQILNDESVAGEDSLLDVRIHLGLQQAFGDGSQPAPAPVVPETTIAPSAVADSDGDGIGDDLDRCPATPAGMRVGADGCVTDADSDGVPDGLDTCPMTPAGFAVDARGCIADSDSDGVPDDRDDCPNTLGQFRVDARGCAVQQTAILEQVHFDLGTDRLDINARTLLQDVVMCLRGQPGMHLELIGHTDAQGGQGFNLNLSKRRAAAVRQHLIQEGIDPQRLAIEGYGEFQPIADNDTADGRARNRRVEMKVTNR